MLGPKPQTLNPEPKTNLYLLTGVPSRLASCSDPTIFHRQDCVGVAATGLQRRWETQDVNFDWIGDALVSVYVVSSGDHWPRRMYAGMDSTSPDTGPSINASSFIAMFYVLVIFIGSFFVLSVGTGVLINTFNAAAFAIDALKPPPSKPTRALLPYVFDAPTTSFVRQKLYRIGQARVTERFISLCILCNVGMMGLESYKISSTISTASDTANFFFTQVFSAEAIV